MRLPRASGVLLHPTSLPGPFGSGDLGEEARHFVDWLALAGQRLWQVLPLGGIGPGDSPYMSPSAFAGNEWLVDPVELARQGWLASDDLAPPAVTDPGRIDYATVLPWRRQRLEKAAAAFAAGATPDQRADFERYAAAQADWLDDSALFMALGEVHGADRGVAWNDWPAPLARREAGALAAAARELAPRLGFWRFVQWCFDRQWAALRAHAHQRGVQIVGDAPIFVAFHSADVWAHPELFDLDEAGRPRVVAGVPPDFFSAVGQRWGNPLYRWKAHAQDDFAWWVRRIRHAFERVDLLRIDHFRGFAACWEIPAGEATAVNGRWVPGPGERLFKAVARALGPMPIIAEDLGVITPDVDALRRRFAFPGMRILQFAFSGNPQDRYLPHNHEPDSVVYTGTHDNNTVAGWWAEAGEAERHFARGYLATDGHEMPWTMIRAACASVADTAIVPMQDVLALGAECRMNLPGQGSGWWRWRLQWSQVHPWHAQRLAELCRLYGRSG
jgi:4-alpha-glucanotransferase